MLDKVKKDKLDKEFIEIFGNFIDAYEEYLSWMERVKNKQGQYHDEDSFPEYVKKNIDLIEDIKRNGILKPIVIRGRVIDGFHRLVIAKKYNLSIEQI